MNNERLKEDQLKIASVQRLFLADLALEADWPEMAQNCHAEANIYTAIVRGETTEDDLRQNILSDYDHLMADRERIIPREVSQSELDSTYREHQALFDKTATVLINMTKVLI